MTSTVGSFLAEITVADLERDPYPIYARLRADAPAAYVPAVDLWLVTRRQDVEYVGSHPEIFRAELTDSPLDASFGGPTILTTDGEAHKDLRRGLDRKYRPKVVNSYIGDLVTPIVEERLDALTGRSSADLLTEYFEPISVRSLGRVLGLGHLDADTLRRWFRGLHQGAINFERDPERQRRNDATAAEIDRELAPIFERLIGAPDDSTISHMLWSGAPAGRHREIAGILPSLKVIILGGMQEPGHGAATTAYALLADPALLDAVRADLDALVLPAIEEGLRWVSPIGTQTREVIHEIEIGGVTLPAGARIGSVVASANRDERMFDDPDDFRLGRGRTHLAFGAGPHFCAGHAFSRGQMTIALRRLLETFPNLRLDTDDQVEFQGWEFRAPGSLLVRLT